MPTGQLHVLFPSPFPPCWFAETTTLLQALQEQAKRSCGGKVNCTVISPHSSLPHAGTAPLGSWLGMPMLRVRGYGNRQSLVPRHSAGALPMPACAAIARASGKNQCPFDPLRSLSRLGRHLVSSPAMATTTTARAGEKGSRTGRPQGPNKQPSLTPSPRLVSHPSITWPAPMDRSEGARAWAAWAVAPRVRAALRPKGMSAGSREGGKPERTAKCHEKQRYPRIRASWGRVPDWRTEPRQGTGVRMGHRAL